MSTKNDRSIKVGDTFGRWSVLGESVKTEKGEIKWSCRCECGTERYVLERGLIYGGSKSCGCGKNANRKTQDLTGKRFGELTVIERIEEKRKGGVWWKCVCDCGEEYEVLGTLLVNGRRTRCSGKKHEKNYVYSDITGQKFGRLTAVSMSDKRNKSGSVIWKCVCDCGNEVEASYNSLMYTNMKSCGCQKKEHDQKLSSFLTHVAGTSVDIMKSKKVPTDNTTGYKGVYFIRGKYVAKIVFQKRAYYLGAFDHIHEAAEARREAEEVLFDGMAKHYEVWKERADLDPEWAMDNPVEVIVSQRRDKKLSVTFLPDMSKFDEKEYERNTTTLKLVRDKYNSELSLTKVI